MLRKRLLVGIAAATLALSAVGVGAANASTSYVNAGITRATASYTAGSSHHVGVYDAYSDGWGAYSTWAANEAGSSGTVTNTSGAGTTAYSGYIISTGNIYYNVCSKNGSTTIGCGPTTSNLIN